MVCLWPFGALESVKFSSQEDQGQNVVKRPVWGGACDYLKYRLKTSELGSSGVAAYKILVLSFPLC